ncbi:MAG TPA: hypothetical protein VE758_00805 [Chthoniobacterales bacterium]|nr:hypothetical protein [Chthoniobacterales bacterium]
MAESNQSKKETVRIALPGEAAGTEGSSEDARTNLPAGPPVNAPAVPSSSSSAQQSDETAGPRKETARVALPSEQPSQAASSEMKKTQPLFTMPEPAEASPPPLAIASESEARVETIPPALCWTVLAASTLLLIIQLWNYFS